MKHVDIFTDGGSLGNPGPGGYGIIVKYKDQEKEFSAGYKLTTNNRMELTGVITALSLLKEKCSAKIYTDSRYVVDGIEKGWARKWKANGWKRNKKDKAENIDLWDKLLDLLEKHDVKFEWVHGHSGHTENERCDKLVRAAALSDANLVDEGYSINKF
jgi:ribonuclease HI